MQAARCWRPGPMGLGWLRSTSQRSTTRCPSMHEALVAAGAESASIPVPSHLLQIINPNAVAAAIAAFLSGKKFGRYSLARISPFGRTSCDRRGMGRRRRRRGVIPGGLRPPSLVRILVQRLVNSGAGYQSSLVSWIRLPQVSFSMAMVEPVTLVGGMVNCAPRPCIRSYSR